jgi:hypothetical protein
MEARVRQNREHGTEVTQTGQDREITDILSMSSKWEQVPWKQE